MAITTARSLEAVGGGEPPATRVLIVAAYAAVRAGLHALLAEVPDVAVVNEVSGSADMEPLLQEAAPDVIVFDHNDADAERVTEIAREAGVALVVLGEDRSGFGALAQAALPGWAYLLKEADAQDVAAAVRAAAAGLVALDRSLGPLLNAPGERTGPVTVGASNPVGEALTVREREVLKLMAQGLPNKVIASRLGISQHTAKFHVASILAKLNAASRTEAVAEGVRRGYIAL